MTILHAQQTIPTSRGILDIVVDDVSYKGLREVSLRLYEEESEGGLWPSNARVSTDRRSEGFVGAWWKLRMDMEH